MLEDAVERLGGGAAFDEDRLGEGGIAEGAAVGEDSGLEFHAGGLAAQTDVGLVSRLDFEPLLDGAVEEIGASSRPVTASAMIRAR